VCRSSAHSSNSAPTSPSRASQAEERFLELIRDAGLPQPEVNVELQGFTVDFFWRSERVVVEIDGYQYHSSRSAFERDRRKELVLDRAGLRVLRFTWSQMREEPLAVIASTVSALARTRASA
jgi:very-short-patch-repair endonuclease